MDSFDIRATADRSIPAVLYLCLMASITVLLLAAPSAKAVPLFCSDISHFPYGLLTGCNPDATSSAAGTGGGYASGGALYQDSSAVDALLFQTHPNPLVQVGPNGLTDAPESKVSDEIPHAKGTTKATPAQSDASSPGAFASTVTKGETWYTMNVDPDGTYLFFGDPEELDKLDEWSTSKTPDDGLPKGIGIGKKWQF